jgi:AcrR family transcriptional regulator
MTTTVNHTERRNIILEQAFVLFSEEGYCGVTYQKIADRCGISRTAIYKYFQNKEDIFTYSVSLAAGNLDLIVKKVLEREEWTALEKIRRILHILIRMLDGNRIFLTVILDYILSQKHTGKDVRRKVRKNTFGIKYVLAKLLREAAESGSLNVNKPETSASILYGILESFVLNLTVTEILDAKDCIGLVDNYLDGLRK